MRRIVVEEIARGRDAPIRCNKPGHHAVVAIHASRGPGRSCRRSRGAMARRKAWVALHPLNALNLADGYTNLSTAVSIGCNDVQLDSSQRARLGGAVSLRGCLILVHGFHPSHSCSTGQELQQPSRLLLVVNGFLHCLYLQV